MQLRLFMPAVVGLTLALPSAAHSWHRGGHMTTARIAWIELEKDKTLRGQLSEILRGHPHCAMYLAAERAENDPEDEWVWMRAATWPDWVREPRAKGLSKQAAHEIETKYNKPAWHFINLPYVHPKDTGTFDADAIRKDILLPELDGKGEPRHALAAIKRCLATLRDAGAAKPDRAVSLCWLLHLVGDVHQPLHASALLASKAQFDPPFLPPEGDRGGNRLAVKLNPTDPSAVDVHSFWDAQLFISEPPKVTNEGLEEASPSFKKVDATAKDLLDDPNLQRDKLPGVKVADPMAWAEESLKIAVQRAYHEGKDFLKAVRVPPGKHPLVGLDAPLLSAEYRDTAKTTARQRIALAGYRLADQLRVALKAP